MREARSVFFLSYAEEDSETGTKVAQWLAGQGLDVYYWQDPQRRGGRFIEQIEKAIGQADAFVALLSQLRAVALVPTGTRAGAAARG